MKPVERWLRKEIRAALDAAVESHRSPACGRRGAPSSTGELNSFLVGWLTSVAQVPRAELDAVIERIKAARTENAA